VPLFFYSEGWWQHHASTVMDDTMDGCQRQRKVVLIHQHFPNESDAFLGVLDADDLPDHTLLRLSLHKGTILYREAKGRPLEVTPTFLLIGFY